MPTLTRSNVTENELATLESVNQNLPEGDLRSTLESVTQSLREGRGVIVEDEEEYLSPAQCAARIGVSRPHFYKLLDSGAIPFTPVGKKDRRVQLSALLAYRQKLEESRAEFARLAADPQSALDAAIDSL